MLLFFLNEIIDIQILYSFIECKKNIERIHLLENIIGSSYSA